jgi:hypothetical protein
MNTDPALRENAMRLARRAETILVLIEVSRSRANTLRGALVKEVTALEALAGFFVFWLGRSMILASSLELQGFLEPSCKHRRSPSSQ